MGRRADARFLWGYYSMPVLAIVAGVVPFAADLADITRGLVTWDGLWAALWLFVAVTSLIWARHCRRWVQEMERLPADGAPRRTVAVRFHQTGWNPGRWRAHLAAADGGPPLSAGPVELMAYQTPRAGKAEVPGVVYLGPGKGELLIETDDQWLFPVPRRWRPRPLTSRVP